MNRIFKCLDLSLGAATAWRACLVVTATFALLFVSHEARGGTAEGACLKGRFKAAAKYEACQQKARADLVSGGEVGAAFQKYGASAAKCAVKYRGEWTKLHAKSLAVPSAETCDASRFVDNGDGTVTDHLTGLQWEQKTDDMGIHDKDDKYSWSGVITTAANGSAYTSFLATLNTPPCFANQCDWRLPTIEELQTILSEGYPCLANPCIDPTFGATRTGDPYYSATRYGVSPSDPTGVDVWVVWFSDGALNHGGKPGPFVVRAVRDGL